MVIFPVWKKTPLFHVLVRLVLWQNKRTACCLPHHRCYQLNLPISGNLTADTHTDSNVQTHKHRETFILLFSGQNYSLGHSDDKHCIKWCITASHLISSAGPLTDWRDLFSIADGHQCGNILVRPSFHWAFIPD